MAKRNLRQTLITDFFKNMEKPPPPPLPKFAFKKQVRMVPNLTTQTRFNTATWRYRQRITRMKEARDLLEENIREEELNLQELERLQEDLDFHRIPYEDSLTPDEFNVRLEAMEPGEHAMFRIYKRRWVQD